MKRPACLLVLLLVCPLESCRSEERAATKPRPPEAAESLVPVPNPLSERNPPHPLVARAVPEAGKPFTDARFKTRLMRVTQRTGLRHEYARYDPFNKGQTRICLTDFASGDLHVYRTAALPYDGKQNLLKTLDFEQPRWDPGDPDLLWGLRDLQIVALNFKTGKTAVVKDFAKDPTIGPILKAEKDLYRITTRHEGEASRDMRFWALLLQGRQDDYRLRYLFTWDRQADRVQGIRKLAKDEEIDWAGMSWTGKYVLIGADPGPGKISGLTMADPQLKRFHRLAHATAHSDVGLDAAGRDVIVMQNSRTDHIDLIPIDWRTRPVGEGDDAYAGTNRTPLVRLFYSSESPVGFHGGVHISCNVPGYCVVSTHVEAGVEEQNWLDRCIIFVRLDAARPAAWYLAKLHNTQKAYWEEPHAAITNDGARVVWATNWNRNVGAERVFLMELRMPPRWPERLK